jgi:hypothetical protein
VHLTSSSAPLISIAPRIVSSKRTIPSGICVCVYVCAYVCVCVYM